MKKKITFKGSQFEIDPEVNQAAYASMKKVWEECPCEDCSAYEEEFHSMNSELKVFLKGIGLDLEKPINVLRFGDYFVVFFAVAGEVLHPQEDDQLKVVKNDRSLFPSDFSRPSFRLELTFQA